MARVRRYDLELDEVEGLSNCGELPPGWHTSVEHSWRMACARGHSVGDHAARCFSDSTDGSRRYPMTSYGDMDATTEAGG